MIRTSLAIVVSTILAACGGASVPVTTSPTLPTTPTGIGLGDMSNTTAVAVQVLSASGQVSGTFTPSTQTGFASGNSFAAMSGDINNPYSYIRFVSNESVAFVWASGSVPVGIARYSGSAIMRVTDVPNNTVYAGTMDANATIRFDSTGASSFDLTNFDGTRQFGVSAPTNDSTSNRHLRIVGLSATSAGGLSSSVSSAVHLFGSQFGDANFDGATFLVDGAFAGPGYDEMGGVIDVTANNGRAQIRFVASQ